MLCSLKVTGLSQHLSQEAIAGAVYCGFHSSAWRNFLEDCYVERNKLIMSFFYQMMCTAAVLSFEDCAVNSVHSCCILHTSERNVLCILVVHELCVVCVTGALVFTCLARFSPCLLAFEIVFVDFENFFPLLRYTSLVVLIRIDINIFLVCPQASPRNPRFRPK